MDVGFNMLAAMGVMDRGELAGDHSAFPETGAGEKPDSDFAAMIKEKLDINQEQAELLAQGEFMAAGEVDADLLAQLQNFLAEIGEDKELEAALLVLLSQLELLDIAELGETEGLKELSEELAELQEILASGAVEDEELDTALLALLSQLESLDIAELGENEGLKELSEELAELQEMLASEDDLSAEALAKLEESFSADLLELISQLEGDESNQEILQELLSQMMSEGGSNTEVLENLADMFSTEVAKMKEFLQQLQGSEEGQAFKARLAAEVGDLLLEATAGSEGTDNTTAFTPEADGFSFLQAEMETGSLAELTKEWLDFNQAFADNSRANMELEQLDLPREWQFSNSELLAEMENDSGNLDLTSKLELTGWQDLQPNVGEEGGDFNITDNLAALMAGEEIAVGSENSEFMSGEFFSGWSGEENFNLAGLENSSNSSFLTEAFGDNPVLDQLFLEIDSMQQKTPTQMEIELEPPWLGRLRLNVSVENGEVMARFLVDSDLVRHELESNVNLLRSALNRQGFNIEQISIDTHDPDTAWQQEDGQQTNEEQNPNYDQDQSAFKPPEEEIAAVLGDLEGFNDEDLEGMSLEMKRWLAWRQYYNHMNVLA